MRDNRYLQAQSAGGNIATYTFHCGTCYHMLFFQGLYISVSFLGCVTIQIQFGFSRCFGRLVVATAMDAAVRYCFRLSVANPALPHPGCPGMAKQLLGGFRGWRMPILPRSNMFFQMKVKNFRRLIRKISRWDKDESRRLTVTTMWLQVTQAIQIIHFFFVRLLHVALFRRLAFGTKPLAIRKRCSQHHLGRSRG